MTGVQTCALPILLEHPAVTMGTAWLTAGCSNTAATAIIRSTFRMPIMFLVRYRSVRPTLEPNALFIALSPPSGIWTVQLLSDA